MIMNDQTFQILYPEKKLVSRGWIISAANDLLADVGAEPTTNLLEAMETLADAGEVTFAQSAMRGQDSCR